MVFMNVLLTKIGDLPISNSPYYSIVSLPAATQNDSSSVRLKMRRHPDAYSMEWVLSNGLAGPFFVVFG